MSEVQSTAAEHYINRQTARGILEKVANSLDKSGQRDLAEKIRDALALMVGDGR